MKKFTLLALLTCFSCLSHAARYSILVGNSSAGKRYEKLRYVANDLNAMRSALSTYCGFKPEHIIELTNSSSHKLRSSIAELQQHVADSDSSDVVLFYYTGHAEHGKLLMGDDTYLLDELKEQLSSFRSRVKIAILDACQSGSITRTKGGSLAEPFLFRNQNTVEGEVVLYSSSESENSQESDVYGNSVFTFHFVNALRGFGDLSADGKVTLDEAYQYSFHQTVSSTVHSPSGVQHPGYQFNIKGEGSVVLADVTTQSSGVIIDEGVLGNITILDKNRTLVAELHKHSRSRARIALSPGFYQVYNHDRSRIQKAGTNVSRKGFSIIAQGDFQRTKGFSARSKGLRLPHYRYGFRPVFGVQHMNMNPTSSAITHSLEQYNLFGFDPQVSIPAFAALSGVAVHVGLRQRYEWYVEFTSVQRAAKQAFFATRSDPHHTGNFKSSYAIDLTFTTSTFRTGIGYHFLHPRLAGTYLRGGVDLIMQRTDGTNTFTDSLFAITATTSFLDEGVLLLPHLAVGYTHSFHKGVSVGIELFGRYQRTPQTLSDQLFSSSEALVYPAGVALQDDQRLPYNFTATGVRLFTTIEFFWGE